MNENINAFMKVLDPEDNSTGGGTASAVAGAMAAALGAMVARLSIGKPDMEPDAYYLHRAARLTTLSNDLFTGGKLDSQAFEAVRSAFRLPKETDADKQARSTAIQTAWIEAAKIPLTNASRCVDVLGLLDELEGRSNENAASDLRCAVYLATAGGRGCLENVAINIPMIKDPAAAGQLEQDLLSLRRKLDGSNA